MFNPIVFLRAAAWEDELLDAAKVVRRVETHGLSLLGVATLVGPIVWRVHCLFAEEIVASSLFLGTLFGQNCGTCEGRLRAIALISHFHAEFLSFRRCQFGRLVLNDFWRLPTYPETLFVKLVHRAAHHAIVAAEVLAGLCILLRLMRYDMVTRVGWTVATYAKALIH